MSRDCPNTAVLRKVPCIKRLSWWSNEIPEVEGLYGRYFPADGEERLGKWAC
jgi:hypothetical protein